MIVVARVEGIDTLQRYTAQLQLKGFRGLHQREELSGSVRGVSHQLYCAGDCGYYFASAVEGPNGDSYAAMTFDG